MQVGGHILFMFTAGFKTLAFVTEPPPLVGTRSCNACIAFRLQDEDSDEYGPPITPETAVAEAIRERTESHLRRTGGTVSAKPIVMRAE